MEPSPAVKSSRVVLHLCSILCDCVALSLIASARLNIRDTYLPFKRGLLFFLSRLEARDTNLYINVFLLCHPLYLRNCWRVLSLSRTAVILHQISCASSVCKRSSPLGLWLWVFLQRWRGRGEPLDLHQKVLMLLVAVCVQFCPNCT